MELSLVIPTYNEKENLVKLLDKIYEEFKSKKISGEVIIVDDNSPDGTAKVVTSMKKKYQSLKLVSRKGKLGLSSAVIAGFKKSKSSVIGVMDADLSHPTEKIPVMFNLIKNEKADFVIGSRYVRGGKILGWGLLRKVLSRGATILAKPFTKVKDPMTGFFMLKKNLLEYDKINSQGFKILLELLLKLRPKKVIEIPITFTNRVEGKSKAGFGEIFYYIGNLLSYGNYVRKIYREFFKYALVGVTGTVINLLFLYIFTSVLGIYYLLSATFSFIIAVTNNYFLNKVWTFGEKIRHKVFTKWGKFLAISIIGLGVNLIFLFFFTSVLGIYYLVSQVFAIILATIVNFLGNKFWTFSN